MQSSDAMQPLHETISYLMKVPNDDYRPYPFWCWNGRITREEITWQMEQCFAQHIFTMLIHPRHGLEIDYLSDEYFSLVKHAASEAKRLGMKIILYDEYNWPSGTVAGRLLRDYPEYGMRFLRYEYIDFTGPGVPDEIYSIHDHDVFCLQAVELESGMTFELQPGEMLPAGRWGVAVFYLVEPSLQLDSVRGHSGASVQHGYLDTMNHAAVHKFIEMTHEAYYRHLQEFIPDVIEAIFTDEPGMIYDFDFGYDFQHATSRSLPWTQKMEYEFERRKGYSLRSCLIRLIADIPGAIHTRLDYWDVATSLYTESYHAQIADWCKRHNLAYTGHNMCEEMSLHYQGDMYESMKHFTIPGVDWTSKVCTLEYPAWLSAKAASSIARVDHKAYVMCEAFGASGWGLQMNEMKRVADILAVLGIHRLCLHSFLYTVRGVRAYECPPSEFFQNPMWEYMGNYSNYLARLGTLLSQGKPLASVGLLLPVKSYWARNCRMGVGSERVFFGDADESVPQICLALAEMGVEFEMVFDSAMNDSMIEQGCLQWGESRIDTLLLPPVQFIKADMWQHLCEFINSGGRVILLGATPAIFDEQGQEIILGSFGVREVLGDGCEVNDVCLKNRIFETLSNKRRIVNCSGDAPVLISCRLLEGGAICVFAYNTNQSECEATFEFEGQYSVEQVDIDSGSITQCGCEQIKGCTRVTSSFMAYESKTWLLSPEENVHHAVIVEPGIEQRIQLGPEWDLRLEKPNVLRVKDMIYIPFASARGAEVFFNIICDELPERVSLVMEQGCARNITVNGEPIKRLKPCRYSDSNQIAVPVEDMLRLGKNRVRMEYMPAPQDEELSALIAYSGITKILPHILVTGDFALTQERHLIKLPSTITNGEWSSKGLGDYAGSCIYTTDVVLSKEFLDTRVTLVCDVGGGYMDVTVNEIECGHRVWEPYKLDISNTLRPGQNRIEIRVSGSPMQFFAPLPGEANCSNSLAFLQRVEDEKKCSGLLSAFIIERKS